MDFSATLTEKKKKELAPKGPYPLLDLEKAKEKFKPYIDKIDAILKEAQDLKVETDEANQKAVELGTSAKSLGKKIDETRIQTISEPFGFVKSVNAFANIFNTKLVTIEGLMKQKISTYRSYQEQRRREAELAAKKATEDVQKKLNEEAKKTGTEPVQVPLAIIPKQEPVTRSESGSAYGRKVWTFRVIDPSLVPREYLVVSDTRVRDAIKGGIREIPGIEIFEESKTSFRV